MFDAVINRALNGGLPLLLLFAGTITGMLALQFTPREEEPQIVVPMVSVLVSAPGLEAKQVERQVTTPLEKLLAQISGVENVYSTSRTSSAEVTLRFYVGENRESALLNTYNKLHSNRDQIPSIVSDWNVKPIEVDDVPIILLGLWSEDASLYSDYELRRVADEIATFLQGITDTNEVHIVGGRQREITIELNPEAMAARQTTIQNITAAIQVSNELVSAGDMTFGNQILKIEAGDYFQSVDELASAVINVIDGIPVHLKDVARVSDGREMATHYQWLEYGAGHASQEPARHGSQPDDAQMITISVAKQRGSDAVRVAQDVHDLLEELKKDVLPPEMHIEVLRDYGVTANDKVNDLVLSLSFAVVTVVTFIGIFLGWRAAMVVALAVPLCYGFTLILDLAFGYTINRVTLFALILSLGLLVDDPITGVDNIERFMRSSSEGVRRKIVMAMSEIKIALIVSTLTIILAFIPLAFITGMMGPYMAPMAFNVPVAVMMSTLVAFFVTPWLAKKLLKPSHDVDDSLPLKSIYSKIVGPFLDSRRQAKKLLYGVLALFLIAALLPLLRLVPLKLLPFDNKSEIQILIDMPEGSTLEATSAEAFRVAAVTKQLPEVKAVGVFVGRPSPNDFNGMVRRYHQRVAPHLADVRLTLVRKEDRVHQSHAVVLRLRQLLRQTDLDADVKVVEVPPGPPVMDTLVAEIYAERITPYSSLIEAAKGVQERLEKEPHVVQVDSTVQATQPVTRFVADKEKAALSGISVRDINQSLRTANAGALVGHMNFSRESTPLPIRMRLPLEERSSENDLNRLQVGSQIDILKQQGTDGLDDAPQSLVSIGELGHFEKRTVDQAIYHKDLKPVVYVTAELSGRTPAEVLADITSDFEADESEQPDWRTRTYLNSGGGISWQLPSGTNLSWSGEGEWKITLRVFRDMGLGFLFALLAIFILLSLQTGSSTLSLIIMSSIPLTIIGIMPGFWLLNHLGEREIAGAPDPVLFTATAMIGMIALAGIVVRNSLILIEFIEQARKKGAELKDALIVAGAVRMRPVLLTAGTTLLGNVIITLDPVFAGLAIAIIFGIISSTIFTLVVVPVVYYLVFDPSPAQVTTT